LRHQRRILSLQPPVFCPRTYGTGVLAKHDLVHATTWYWGTAGGPRYFHLNKKSAPERKPGAVNRQDTMSQRVVPLDWTVVDASRVNPHVFAACRAVCAAVSEGIFLAVWEIDFADGLHLNALRRAPEAAIRTSGGSLASGNKLTGDGRGYGDGCPLHNDVPAEPRNC
jgi:hypothetical protein